MLVRRTFSLRQAHVWLSVDVILQRSRYFKSNEAREPADVRSSASFPLLLFVPLYYEDTFLSILNGFCFL